MTSSTSGKGGGYGKTSGKGIVNTSTPHAFKASALYPLRGSAPFSHSFNPEEQQGLHAAEHVHRDPRSGKPGTTDDILKDVLTDTRLPENLDHSTSKGY